MVWHIAALETVWSQHFTIQPAHLWLGILSLSKGLGGAFGEQLELSEGDEQALRDELDRLIETLSPFGLVFKKWRHAVRDQLGYGEGPERQETVHRSAETKALFERAEALAEGGLTDVNCLLRALLEAPGEAAAVGLAEIGIYLDEIESALCGRGRPALEKAFSHETRDFPSLTPTPISMTALHLQQQLVAPASQRLPGKSLGLEGFGRDLTALARQGKLGPVVGREKESEQVVGCLLRKTKNNPVLVGPPGVGKTAVVEALAVAMVTNPDHPLKGRRLVEISMGSLTAGTKYRGEFEERIEKLLEAVAQAPELILFVDEFHTLVGAGRTESNNLNAANLLKPALARGELSLIGATTEREYQKFVTQDQALERRLDKIQVKEPPRSEVVKILQAVVQSLAQHHRLEYCEQALEAAIDLSQRYESQKKFPDKAIDLLDQAGASARRQKKERVDRRVVAEVLSTRLGVPLEVLLGSQSDQPRVLELEPFLEGNLFGQEEAIRQVSERLILAHSGLGEQRGPLATFLFLGPPGVGKTEMARLLAAFFFDEAMIRLDMSEFGESHSVSRLIGSPPGYVGEREGQLTGALAHHPYSLVLLDEVEKAHPRVFDLFLQVFDEGHLSNAAGKKVDASQALFVMTSNLGSAPESKGSIGFIKREETSTRTDVRDALLDYFRPEFLDRIQEIVSFQPLTREAMIEIVRRRLEKAAERLTRRHRIRVEWSANLLEAILDEIEASGGVRQADRLLERRILLPLGRLTLSRDLKSASVYRALWREGECHFEDHPMGTVVDPSTLKESGGSQ